MPEKQRNLSRVLSFTHRRSCRSEAGQDIKHNRGAQVEQEIGLTANAAELDVADVELVLDGELASQVKGYICEVEVLEVHLEACRYPCQDELGRNIETSAGARRYTTREAIGGVTKRDRRPHAAQNKTRHEPHRKDRPT